MGRLRATFKVTMLLRINARAQTVSLLLRVKSHTWICQQSIFRSAYLPEAILRCVCLDSSWLANTSVTRLLVLKPEASCENCSFNSLL